MRPSRKPSTTQIKLGTNQAINRLPRGDSKQWRWSDQLLKLNYELSSVTTIRSPQEATTDRHLESSAVGRSAARRRRDAAAASAGARGAADLGFKAPRRGRGSRRRAPGEAERAAAKLAASARRWKRIGGCCSGGGGSCPRRVSDATGQGRTGVEEPRTARWVSCSWL